MKGKEIEGVVVWIPGIKGKLEINMVELGGNVIDRVRNMDYSAVLQLVGDGKEFGCSARDGMEGSGSGGKVGIGGQVVCRR